ncbi:MAG: acyloxyacyl hydrolase [Rickettsiales bacterium]|nr:acyloxyacyl hydrolase [Rickettsiales bacterium]
MRLTFLHPIALAIILFAHTPANASDYLGVYAGYFDVTQDDNSATQFGAEYRYEDIYHGLRPGLGINATTDGSVYGYGGFFWDIPLGMNFILTPNVVAGAYHSGDGKKLHHGLEFRSGLELSYQFPYGTRLGVAFNHISNASIGKHNPGAETLLVIYQHPLNWFGSAPKQQQKRWWHK